MAQTILGPLCVEHTAYIAYPFSFVLFYIEVQVSHENQIHHRLVLVSRELISLSSAWIGLDSSFSDVNE